MLCPNCKSENWVGFGDSPWERGEGLKCSNCNFVIDEYLPNPNKIIWHPKDIEYFKEFPAPLMENIHRMHFVNVNSTITFFSPLFYFFARAVEAHRILEIGTAEGYSSFYWAHAIKDNGIRYNVSDGEFIGIDIVQTESTQEKLLAEHLPVKIYNMDSMTLKTNSFGDRFFDVIMQDGAHDTEHVLYELEVLYPQLKPNGYWIFHDSAGPAEEAWHKIIKDDRYKFEYIRFITPYGMSMMRKIEGVDSEKRYWI